MPWSDEPWYDLYIYEQNRKLDLLKENQMPLDKSKTKEAFKNNVKKEIQSGKPAKQAVAIAYSAQGEKKTKLKKKK